MKTMTDRKNCMRTMALLPALALLGCLGGGDGKDGVNSTIRTTVEPAGENCANGGIKIEVLLDGEVQNDQTQYICNGNNGSDGSGSTPGNNGTSASVRTAAEPAGENCANGGIKIEVLLDGEVQDAQTQYICNGIDGTVGTNGTNATIQTAQEPAGTNCENGGIKIEVLLDGAAQPEQTQYICNGEDGQNGTNGSNASIRTSTVAVGSSQCANGGIKIEVLLNNVVQTGQTKYICNGTNGTNGTDGRDGCDASMHRDSSGACVPNPEGFIYIPAGKMTLTYSTSTGYSVGQAVYFNAFFMKKTPVTVREFMECVEGGICSSQHYNTHSNDGRCNYGRGENYYNHPMNCVNKMGALTYCVWAGGQLPTEFEWEYAATHNGTEHLNTKYAFGNTLKHCRNANYKASGTNPYCNGIFDSPTGGTSPVGIYNGNSPLGLVDMTGNVAEWTTSRFSSSGTNGVMRGGSWLWEEAMQSVTYRAQVDPENKYDMYGIRCMMDVE